MTSPTVVARPPRSAAFELVVLSGSAGGIEAASAVLSALPAEFPVPIILVLHHAVGRGAMITEILGRRTRLRVCAAVDDLVLAPGCVYLAPADRHMRITPGGRIASTDHRKINYLRSSSDPLLESVVSEFGARAIAVILSGSGKNGCRGAKLLHDAGGIVLAQDQATSRNFGMPRAAIELGAVDRVLPLHDIGDVLVSLTSGRA